ncbi:hypothetical protein HF521_021730, partial [Silurus meridionalis]
LVASHRVEQSPPDIIQNHTDFAQLYCSYAVKNFEQILWYKQSMENNLIYLGYQNVKYTYSEKDTRINLGKDKIRSATFNINSLTAKDSGVYFCAVQIHRVSGAPSSSTKTLLAEDSGVTQIPSVSWHLKGKS